jgi:hypothetical protein
MKHIAFCFFGGLFFFGQLSNVVAETISAASCKSLVAESFDASVGAQVMVTKADVVAADGDQPAYCHVLANIAPSNGVEIQLPLSNWNGRMLFTGCGGACGRIRTSQGADALTRNYAVATSDMGHSMEPGQDPRWWINDQELVDEFQYRATHRATLLTKAVIASAYDRAQDYAYFRGCSSGGRQGLTAAVMYPDDFDGVIAGAVGTKVVIPHNVFAYASNTRQDGSSILTADTITLLHNNVMAACDMDDGLKDNVIGDPMRCGFEASTLLCENGQTQSCLTQEQIVAANKVYDGPRREDGSPFNALGYAKGSEMDWIRIFVGTEGQAPRGEAVTKFALDRMVAPGAALSDFDYAKHGTRGSPLSGKIDLGPNGKKLGTYVENGGKILMYHGWLDLVATPAASFYFYDAQADVFGEDALPDFMRLFMFPGMKHCRDGNGVNTADYLNAMVQWVEHNEAPESIDAYGSTAEPFNYIAHPLDPDTVLAGRKIFPYPASSEYDGAGDVLDPDSWTRKPSDQ